MKIVDSNRTPPFSDMWQAAEKRYALARRRYRRVASAAAIIAISVVAGNWSSLPSQQLTFIELADLLESTSWSAPSDALLPEHQFDIYQEIPRLTEST